MATSQDQGLKKVLPCNESSTLPSKVQHPAVRQCPSNSGLIRVWVVGSLRAADDV